MIGCAVVVHVTRSFFAILPLVAIALACADTRRPGGPPGGRPQNADATARDQGDPQDADQTNEDGGADDATTPSDATADAGFFDAITFPDAIPRDADPIDFGFPDNGFPTDATPNDAAMGTSFSAILSGMSEVPPVSSFAFGIASFTLDTATGTLQYNVEFFGFTATAAHIHRGAIDMNGPVVVPLSGTTSPISGAASIDPQIAMDLANGLLYVNVHSAANPGGEIRGQIQ